MPANRVKEDPIMKFSRTYVAVSLALALGNVILAKEPLPVVITKSNGMSVRGVTAPRIGTANR